jgi:hypothetical protein
MEDLLEEAFGLTEGSMAHDAEMEEREAIGRARAKLQEELRAGTTCPVCDQHAREYRRVLNAGMANALVVMYQAAGLDWFHKPTVLRGVGAAARDESLLRYWGLIEERRGRKASEGHAGFWRVTPAGEEFVQGNSKVDSHVVIYNGIFRGFEGDPVDISDALGRPFSLRDLLDAA